MCGVAGIVWKDRGARASTDLVRRMTDALVHRGPDGEGVWVKGAVAFGHRRLSIIDLSHAADQPMVSHDGKHVLVFNGELYNYVELREELKARGRAFKTSSDSEVLLEAFRVWGPSCVERFNGMWAFAVWDVERETLFLSRDRFGIKPLYVLETRDHIAFASEVKALLAAFPEERKPDDATIRRFLSTGALCEGTETFFKNIRAFPAAHNASWSASTATWTHARYWDVEPEVLRARMRGRDSVHALEELLDAAVRVHLRSDVPVGTCLSGGLDSSAIVATMARHHPQRVHTYSGLYDDVDCDESRWVNDVNRHVGTLATAVRPDPHGDLLDDMTTIGWFQDAPSGGPGLYTQFHVMKRASQDVKVILDGQGGDELFAGYLPYFRPRLRDLVESGPVGKARAAVVAADVLRLWGRQFHRGIVTWAVGERVARHLVKTRTIASLLHRDFEARVPARAPPDAARPMGSHLDDALYLDLVTRSIPGLLHYEDRNSMAFSIEARVPLLDHRIVELAFGIDPGDKIHGSWTKWVLRKAAESRLPRSVTWRRSKMGYPTPFARWIRRDEDRARLRDVLFSKELRERGVVDVDVVRRVWDDHQAGVDHSWPLWRVLSLEIWFRQYIDAWAPAVARPSSSSPPRSAA
jgi:asparagine synthase (glutamine-hydrolysing)